MKGFSIVCKSEKGEEVFLRDLNANKKVFEIVTVKTKPFLETNFYLKKRGFTANSMKKMFSLVPDDELKAHLSRKMREYGAEEGVDYEVRLLE